MTRGDLRSRILETLNESASTPVFWSESEINDLIDEGAEVICEESQAIKRTVFVPLRPGTAYYSLSALGPNIMAPYRIWHHAQDRRLDAKGMSQLDLEHETWSTVTGDPWYWFPVSWDLFGIWPASSQGGGVLRVDCLAWPAALQDDDEEPEFLAADHDALVLYAVAEGSAKRWDVPTAISAWSLFMKAAGASTQRSGVGRAQSRSFRRAQAQTASE